MRLYIYILLYPTKSVLLLNENTPNRLYSSDTKPIAKNLPFYAISVLQIFMSLVGPFFSSNYTSFSTFVLFFGLDFTVSE